MKTCPQHLELLLDGRILKINTVFSADGVKFALASKADGDDRVAFSAIVALILPPEWEKYVKTLESFQTKRAKNKHLLPDEVHDGISREKNICLYELLTEKMGKWPFAQFPRNQRDNLIKGRDIFTERELPDQISCLLNIIQLMGPGSAGVDLKSCGGGGQAGKKVLSTRLSNWKNSYSDVRIIDESASGLFSRSSENLLDLL